MLLRKNSVWKRFMKKRRLGLYKERMPHKETFPVLFFKLLRSVVCEKQCRMKNLKNKKMWGKNRRNRVV